MMVQLPRDEAVQALHVSLTVSDLSATLSGCHGSKP